MSVSPLTVFVVLVVFGFLSGSTIYFYNRSQSETVKQKNAEATFQAESLPSPAETSSKVDELTAPAEPRGRLSYPANVYKVQAKESLFTIGEKMGVSWQTIKSANGLKDENVIQADFPLVIPKVSKETDYFRVNFVVDEAKASELNRELRDKESSEWYDPVEVAKKHVEPYFNALKTDVFSLVEADLSKGTALVEVKSETRLIYVGLIQPKIKGKKGLWALYYVEDRSK